MSPLIPPAAIGAVLRVAGKPVLGSALPIGIQRLGVSTLCALLPGIKVPTSAGEIAGVPVVELTPAGAPPGATLLYFHGGGYATGSARGYLPFLSRLAVATGTRLIAVDYRLAPEHPFPAAHSDGSAVYAALLESGVDPSELTVAGDSAGGGLAVATVVAAREAGLALPRRMYLISPWLDLRLSAAGDDRQDALLSRRGTDRWADIYCAGHPRIDPRVSPLFADLSGLPPVLIQYDTGETLARQSVSFVASARAAGVTVDDQPFSGYWHDFQLFTMLPAARAAVTMAAVFVRTVSM